MACLLIALLVTSTTTTDQILYLPPPNSVDDYVRVDFPAGDSPIKDLTIAAWVQPTTLDDDDRTKKFIFFSYDSTTSGDIFGNLITLGGSEGTCSGFAIGGAWNLSSACSSYNIPYVL